MNINIEFFKDQINEAIGAGIYQIDICRGDNIEPLYIGESKTVLMRCSAHLYELKKEPCYLGFSEETISDSSITLRFTLLECVEDSAERKKREKEYVAERKPISQSGISDRQKSVEDKINSIIDFINRT